MCTHFWGGARVKPCIFGGVPDCSQCGCAISSGLHWLRTVRAARLVKTSTLVNNSVALGSLVGKLRSDYHIHPRWTTKPAVPERQLVQIDTRRTSDRQN